jgi:hypothetical protein
VDAVRGFVHISAMLRVAPKHSLKLVGGRPGRFFVCGTVACPACTRPLAMLDLGDIEDGFRLQCDGCGSVSVHDKTDVHVDVRRERRSGHRPF